MTVPVLAKSAPVHQFHHINAPLAALELGEKIR
jgi:hypothetical protein